MQVAGVKVDWHLLLKISCLIVFTVFVFACCWLFCLLLCCLKDLFTDQCGISALDVVVC